MSWGPQRPNLTLSHAITGLEQAAFLPNYPVIPHGDEAGTSEFASPPDEAGHQLVSYFIGNYSVDGHSIAIFADEVTVEFRELFPRSLPEEVAILIARRNGLKHILGIPVSPSFGILAISGER